MVEGGPSPEQQVPGARGAPAGRPLWQTAPTPVCTAPAARHEPVALPLSLTSPLFFEASDELR